jgi:hypothetical protein
MGLRFKPASYFTSGVGTVVDELLRDSNDVERGTRRGGV